MLARVSTVLAAAALIGAAAPNAPARAADRVIAHDTLISRIWPLDGDLLYRRWQYKKPLPKRVWMARYHGHLHAARGIPRNAAGTALGLDAKGRKVFTAGVVRTKGGYPASAKWYVYDLASNRTRRLRGLPTKCAVDWVSLWRDTLAYRSWCRGKTAPVLLLRRGNHTRKLAFDPWGRDAVFRGGAFASIFEDGNDDEQVAQYMSNGKTCRQYVDAGRGDATSETGWFPTDLWIANGYLTWVMGDPAVRSDFAILAARIRPGCAQPSPVGVRPFKPETTSLRTFAVDSHSIFYAGGKTLRRHPIPSSPSYDPPANDNFENAQQLTGAPPLSATGRVAHATVQPGEPLADTKHTVWYAYRPTTSGTVYAWVPGACAEQSDACGGQLRYGVYTGTPPAELTELPRSRNQFDQPYTRIDAVAGETYWIAAGSSAFEANYEPFTVHVDASPPG